MAAVAFGPLAAEDNPKDRAGWWIKEFGPLSGDKKSAELADRVFARVAAAADKSGNRLPKLVLINAADEPWALALPDGSIVVTRGGLALTLGKARDAAGETRLAFVLGHELAHLAKDDFWHASAFSAAKKYGKKTSARDRQSTFGLVEATPAEQKTAELQADAFGLLYASWAGYSPERLLDGPKTFFDQWALATGVQTDLAHPSAENRANLIRSQLAQVADDLDYFHFGVRLLELGRYDDALLLLDRFKDRYASREVFTNLGLVHHQMALRELARCDGQLAMRFALPVEADPVTLAERSRLRGSTDPSDVCRESPAFREHWTAARRLLELARDRDASYLPARIDLIATLLLGARNAEAIVVAEEALKLDPQAPALLNGRGLGIYLFGLESRLETTDAALALLDQALKAAPASAAVLFNRARILDERGRAAAARDAWQAYLAVDASGPRAEIARQRLGLAAATTTATTAGPRASLAASNGAPTAPLPLGSIAPATAERLRTLERQPFVLGDFRGAFLRGTLSAPGGAGLRSSAKSSLEIAALEIGSALEIVEVAAAPGAAFDARALGSPVRRVETPQGEVLVFPEVAAVLEHGTLTAWLHFAPAPRASN